MGRQGILLARARRKFGVVRSTEGFRLIEPLDDVVPTWEGSLGYYCLADAGPLLCS